jgi:hypothetical protein
VIYEAARRRLDRPATWAQGQPEPRRQRVARLPRARVQAGAGDADVREHVQAAAPEHPHAERRALAASRWDACDGAVNPKACSPAASASAGSTCPASSTSPRGCWCSRRRTRTRSGACCRGSGSRPTTPSPRAARPRAVRDVGEAGVHHAHRGRRGRLRRHQGAVAERRASGSKIKEVAYDPWNATQIALQLQDQGATMVEFGQGFASMSEPTKELEKLVMIGKLAHGGNPVLRWMAATCRSKSDPAGNLKPRRRRAPSASTASSRRDGASRHDKRAMRTAAWNPDTVKKPRQAKDHVTRASEARRPAGRCANPRSGSTRRSAGRRRPLRACRSARDGAEPVGRVGVRARHQRDDRLAAVVRLPRTPTAAASGRRRTRRTAAARRAESRHDGDGLEGNQRRARPDCGATPTRDRPRRRDRPWPRCSRSTRRACTPMRRGTAGCSTR